VPNESVRRFTNNFDNISLMPITLHHLRRMAISRSLFPPTTLKRALHRMGFVQADPIRAPARAQDLILRHRVKDYRAGDLERRYAKLGVHEDFFINYGFVTTELQALMHPRRSARVPAEGVLPWPRGRRKRAELLLDFVREKGTVHPQEVDRYFSHGRVTNYWGGSSNATTHLLDAMHYQGLLRVVGRASGIRLYAVHEHGLGPGDKKERDARLDALVDAAVDVYAPMPVASMRYLVRRLRFAAPQWEKVLTATLQRALERLSHTKIDGVEWYWPAGESMNNASPLDTVRLLTPFDPIVWDRDRFEQFWGWTYRFEAYTPAHKRVRGYYALPMLWRDQVIGWGNLAVKDGELRSDLGYVNSAPPKDRNFARELEAELERMRTFLGAGSASNRIVSNDRSALDRPHPL
jgi:uncharacterized protein YcaQ